MNRLSIWRRIKRLVIVVACILFCATFGFILMQLLKISLTPYQVTSSEIVVHQARTDNNNLSQNNADVEIFSVNGKLYYFIKNWTPSLGLRSKFSDKLCTIENGRLHVLQKVSTIYGNDNRFIYYKYKDQLMAHDTQSGKASVLTQITEYTRYDVVQQSDGTLTFLRQIQTQLAFLFRMESCLNRRAA